MMKIIFLGSIFVVLFSGCASKSVNHSSSYDNAHKESKAAHDQLRKD